MKITPIKQRDASACGPTCIEMVLTYYQIPHTVKGLAAVTDYKHEGGMDNRQIVSILKHFGLKTSVKKNTTWDELKAANTPDTVIIVSWMLEGYIGHVSVVEKVDDTHIYLAEPTTGNILKIEKLRFLRLWLDYEARTEVPMYPESKLDIQLRWMVVVRR